MISKGSLGESFLFKLTLLRLACQLNTQFRNNQSRDNTRCLGSGYLISQEDSSCTYSRISSTRQLRIRHKSSTFMVLMPMPLRMRSMVALLILYLFMRVYVLSPAFFRVSQKGVYTIINITEINDKMWSHT